MLYAIVGLLVIIADQWVKFWVANHISMSSAGEEFIPGILSLVNVHNDGAAFGFLSGSGARIPFIILAVAIIPLTRLVTGTSIGSTAAIVPLVVAAAPLVARSVESSVKGVDSGVIEAARSMGATTWQIIKKVMLPEALPSLITGLASATITVLGFSAMAGAFGGGGLGAIAINYGYYRGQSDIMYVMVILLVLMVQIIQKIGDRMSVRVDKTIRESGSAAPEDNNTEH